MRLSLIDNEREINYNSVMKKKVLVFILMLSLMAVYSYSKRENVKLTAKERRQAIKSLSQHHKYWYDLITYISTKEEKAVFLKLENNRDLDLFIKSFWLQRDPTPGTPENEYKNEIEKRFIYANEHYGRGVGRPGWMTDMGKFHIILGQPISIDRFDSKPGLYPAQVWYYYGDKRLGLPTYFNVTFFKPRNSTEWKLYNPASDGPAALMVLQQPVDRSDYDTLYAKIYEIAPTLAKASISMIPEAAQGYYTFAVSLRSNLILSNIYESPKRKINVSYATNFLNYKGFVNVDASINYIENTHQVSITRYERFGFNFVNISVKPKQLSLGYNDDKDQYYFNLELSVSLKKDEEFIYQYSKNFDFYIDPDKVQNLKGNGIVIHDTFPVLPGKYQLMVFLKNTVGKEFTYFDTYIESMPEGKMPMLSTPVLGYKLEQRADNFFYPYRIRDSKLFVDTDNTFRLNAKPNLWIGVYNLEKDLWKNGKVEIHLRGLNDRIKFEKKYTLALSDYNYSKNLNIIHSLSEKGLGPDYYDCDVKLVNHLGMVIDKKGNNFSISPLKTVAYPMESFKRSRIDNPYFVYFIMGSQYESVGDLQKAETFYERCINNRPEFKKGIVAFLSILNRLKKYTKVLVEVEKIKKDKDLKFDYFLIKGIALYGMKDYDNALDQFLKANEIYNSDIRVLNLLGFTLSNLKNYEEALKAFEASLNLNGKQPFIRKVHNEVKQRLGLSQPDQQ
ncbi:MAG: GWxTD domain-containing protein [Candidatus Aminicenantes bacterium]|nr:GWxTD domain-containing protein [Candidatus Aminicenantes bacterium]